MIFLVFCGIFLMMNWVTVNIYLFVWDAMMLATACGYLKRENEAFLRKILRVSLISAVAYVLVRIVRGNIFSWSLEGRSWVFYALTVIAVGLVTVFFVSLWKYRKSGNMESGQETSGKEGTGDGVTETLLRSRKHDLKRVETYLEQVHIVGINGEWGTGKTFLMEEFCRKHGEEYEFVRVDLLTCNLDQVDVFLLQEMEAILRKHRIYPRYSRSLCNMMKDHSWLKDLRELLRMDNEVKAVVFDGFRQDMKKLGKPVVVIVEDLDRVADGKVIRKILDLTERLSCDWIKVVMEYDVENLKELGFDRKYIEKYIPYVIEPSVGVERLMLAVMCEAYQEEQLENDSRVVLKLHPALAPYKVAVLPLSKKLSDQGDEVFAKLSKHFSVTYDDAQSIGKRYRRQDAIGTPFCVTVDFETANDGCVTIRDRDTMQQERVALDDLVSYIENRIAF